MKRAIGILVCVLALMMIYSPQTGMSKVTPAIIEAIAPGDKYVAITFNDIRFDTMTEGKAYFEEQTKRIETLAQAQAIVLPAPENKNYYLSSSDNIYALSGNVTYRLTPEVAEPFAKLLEAHHYKAEISDVRGSCGG